jgi:hypothetical protein
MRTKTKNARRFRISAKPIHKKLPWPGLKDEDSLTRVVTAYLKDAREAEETGAWAQKQIARVLDYLPPETAMRLLFKEMWRRNRPVPEFAEVSARACEEAIKYGAWCDSPANG